MSVTIGYYFNANQPPHQFAESVNGALGCLLTPYEGDYTDFYCRFLSMELTLGHNPLETDRLNLNDYGYVIDVRIPAPDNELLPIATQMMMAVAYVLHIRLDIHKGLLVWDLQTAIAEYSLRRNEQNEELWYDSISGKFVMYPEHWIEVLCQ